MHGDAGVCAVMSAGLVRVRAIVSKAERRTADLESSVTITRPTVLLTDGPGPTISWNARSWSARGSRS